jgi:hypothetical protein
MVVSKEEGGSMRKSLTVILGLTVLLVSLTAIAHAQTTQTTTVTKVQAVQNPDGTYTIVEYPVGKETIVTLNPIGITGATGTATILRDANGATIKVNFTKLPADLAAVNLYAVDSTGAVSMLGPVEIANGVGTFTTTAPISKFMLFASPDASLSAYDANTKVIFRSAVPSGFTVIPISKDQAVGEQVAATAAVPVATEPVTTAPVDHSAGSRGDGNHWAGDRYYSGRRCSCGLHGPDAWDPYFQEG